MKIRPDNSMLTMIIAAKEYLNLSSEKIVQVGILMDSSYVEGFLDAVNTFSRAPFPELGSGH